MSAHLVTVAMGCIGGMDDSNGSTPRAAETVITEIKTETVKKARVSVSLFIVLEKKVCKF